MDTVNNVVAEINYDKLIEDIRKFTMTAVTEKRYAHSVRTAQMCKKLCERYGLNGQKGYLCGIAHDMCKKMDDDLVTAIASKDGKPISDLEKEKPALLHGRAAAVKIRQDFGVTEPDVIEAIANHTFGGPGLSDLAKLLFVADKIEPGREHVTEKYLDRLFSMDLNEMVYTVVSESCQYLAKKGKKMSPVTKQFLDELEKSVK